jgi:hypothetical protein
LSTPTYAETMRAVIDSVFTGDSKLAWRAHAAAMFAVPPAPGEHEVFERCTGRSRWPTSPASEVFDIVGRRGGKSVFAGRIGAVLSNYCDYRGVLGPGERGVGMLVAADRRQARVVKGYSAALCTALGRVKRQTKDAIELVNNVVIEIHTRSFRSTRGYTVLWCIAEELAYWPSDDGADPDAEVLNAVRPAMATVPDALLMCISSPYARRGELWRAYREHYGREADSTLVWMADTRTMNPNVPQRVIDQAFARDEAVAWSEYGRDGRIEFRRDVETFIAREVLDACVVPQRYELPPGAAA